MTTLKAIILGAVQGFAEFLPISSSGHLVIFNHLLASQGSSDLLFDVLVHLGTFLAVLVAFWGGEPVIIPNAEGGRTTPSRNFLYMLVLSLLPLFLVLPVKGFIELLFQNPVFVGFALLVTGCILLLSSRFSEGRIGAASVRARQALVVGFTQLIAIIPGVSRSGSTITAGLACGFKRDFAVRYSFLLSLPTTLAAVFLEFYDVIKEGALPENWTPYLVGMVASRDNKFSAFSYYCFVVGCATIIYFGFIR